MSQSNVEMRVERDSIGEIEIPVDASALMSSMMTGSLDSIISNGCSILPKAERMKARRAISHSFPATLRGILMNSRQY